MHQKQMRELVRSPKAAVRFITTGKLPRITTPTSPLITLLETFTTMERKNIVGVQLTPKLGYNIGLRFRDAEQLYRWVKPSLQVLEGETWPAEECRLKTFQRKLTWADLAPFCVGWPIRLTLSQRSR
jgi:hypothetical protein